MRKLIFVIFFFILFEPSVNGGSNSCVQGKNPFTANTNSNEDSLPSRPEIIDATLSYDYFDYKTKKFINPIFKFKIKSKRSEGFKAIVSTEKDDNTIDYYVIYEKFSEDTFIIYENHLNWNSIVCFYAYNQRGLSQKSKPIKVLDLIKDKTVLDTMNNWLSIKSIQEEFPSYEKKDGLLTVKGLVQSIEVFNIEGQCVKRAAQQQTIDLRSLPKGIYIVLLRHNNKTKTIKI